MNEEIIEHLNERLDDALEHGKRSVKEDELERRMDDIKKRTESIIKKHPLKSIAAGLAAGYILGKLFSTDD